MTELKLRCCYAVLLQQIGSLEFVFGEGKGLIGVNGRNNTCKCLIQKDLVLCLLSGIIGEEEVKFVNFAFAVIDMPLLGYSMAQINICYRLDAALFEPFDHFLLDFVTAAVFVHPHSDLSTHSTILAI